MVAGIRTVEKALGKAQKALEPMERDAYLYARRSVTSQVAIPQGHRHHPRDAHLQASRHRHQREAPRPGGGPRGPGRHPRRHHHHLGDGLAATTARTPSGSRLNFSVSAAARSSPGDVHPRVVRPPDVGDVLPAVGPDHVPRTPSTCPIAATVWPRPGTSSGPGATLASRSVSTAAGDGRRVGVQQRLRGVELPGDDGVDGPQVDDDHELREPAAGAAGAIAADPLGLRDVPERAPARGGMQRQRQARHQVQVVRVQRHRHRAREGECARRATARCWSSTGKAAGGTIRPPPPEARQERGESSGLTSSAETSSAAGFSPTTSSKVIDRSAPTPPGSCDGPRRFVSGDGEGDVGLGEHAGSRCQHAGDAREAGVIAKRITASVASAMPEFSRRDRLRPEYGPCRRSSASRSRWEN